MLKLDISVHFFHTIFKTKYLHTGKIYESNFLVSVVITSYNVDVPQKVKNQLALLHTRDSIVWRWMHQKSGEQRFLYYP